MAPSVEVIKMTRLEASKRLVIAESLAAQYPTQENIEAAKDARRIYEEAVNRDRNCKKAR